MKTSIIPSLIFSIAIVVSAYLISSAIKFHANAVGGPKSIIVGFDPMTRAAFSGPNGFKISLDGNIGVDATTRYPLKFENAAGQK